MITFSVFVHNLFKNSIILVACQHFIFKSLPIFYQNHITSP